MKYCINIIFKRLLVFIWQRDLKQRVAFPQAFKNP